LKLNFLLKNLYYKPRYNVCLIGIKRASELNESTTHNSSFFSKKNDFAHSNQSVNIDMNNNNTATMNMLLNPGPDYELEAQDTCFYISLVKEENYDWRNCRTKICKFINTILMF